MEGKGKYKNFRLHSAAYSGQIEECRRLIAEGSDVNESDLDDSTPLMYAARFGHSAIVELLHQNGGSCGTTNIYGYSPLCMAVASDDENTFEYILHALLKTFKEDLRKETLALELACLQGRTKFVKRLLSFNVFDINDSNKIPGITPLLLTSYGGCVDTGKLLLELGADKSAKNLVNQTAYDISVYKNDTRLQALLSDKDCSRNVSSPMMCLNGHAIACSAAPLDEHFMFPSSPWISVQSEPSNMKRHIGVLHERLKISGNLLYDNVSPGFFEVEGRSCQNCYVNSLISPRFLYSPQINAKKQVDTSHMKAIKAKGARSNRNKYGYISWIKEKVTRRRTKSVEECFDSGEATNVFLFDEARIRNNVTVTKLLTGLNLEEYISIFIRQELDANTILTLTESDLTAMGIEKEERKNILKKIDHFKLQN